MQDQYTETVINEVLEKLENSQDMQTTVEDEQTVYTLVGFVLAVKNSDQTDYFLKTKSEVYVLDLKRLCFYSIYPGQFIKVTGFCGENTIYAQSVQKLGFSQEKHPQGTWTLSSNPRILVAGGPYSGKEDLEYEFLQTIIEAVHSSNPSTVVLMGPFIEQSNTLISKCQVHSNYFGVQNGTIMELQNKIFEQIKKETLGKEVVVLPSPKDIAHPFPIPSVPFQWPSAEEWFKMCPSPSVFKLQDLTLAVLPYDIIHQLVKNTETLSDRKSNKIATAMENLLISSNFAPVLPSGLQVDPLLLKELFWDSVPDIILTTSKMHFTRQEVFGTLFLNSQKSPDYLLLEVLPPGPPISSRVECLNNP